MSRARIAAGLLLAGALAVLGPASAAAESLDWSDVAWTDGELGPNAYDSVSVPSLGARTLTVEVADPDDATPAGWPRIEPGVSGFDESFRNRADFSTAVDITNPNAESIRVTWSLDAPVSNLVFEMGDIDTGSASSPYSGWQDIVIVTAFFQGVEVPVSAVALGPSVGIDTNGNDYSTALNASLYGASGNVANGSTAANARITIPGPVDLVRIDYYPGHGSDRLPGRGPTNPNSQVVQLHDPVFDAEADVSLTKSVSDPSAAVGDTVTWTLTATGGGPAIATGVQVEDVLPAGFAYVPGSLAGGATRDETAAPVLSWTLAPLAPGDSSVLSFDAVVQPPAGGANEYRNVAQVVAADQPDPDSAPANDDGDQSEDDEASATVTPPLAEADLSLAKAASAPTPSPGDVVTFTVTVSNSGPETATNVAVEDVLPAGFAYVPGTIAGGTGTDDSAAPVLRWSVASLAAASSVDLRFDAVVQAPTGAPGEHRNVAQVTASDQPDPDSTPANDDGDQSEDDEAALTLAPLAAGISFAPDQQRTTLPGSVVFYAHTFTASVAGDVRFTLASSSATPGWQQALFHDLDCSGTLDAAEPALQPTDSVAVAPAASVCVVVRESVPPGAPAGAQDLVIASASFTPTAGGGPLVASVQDVTTVATAGGAGLALEKTVDKTTAFPGDSVLYTIRFRNQGSGPITDLVITDATPAFTTYLGASAQCAVPLPAALVGCTITEPSGGTAGSLDWTFGGALDPGQEGTVSYSVTID